MTREDLFEINIIAAPPEEMQSPQADNFIDDMKTQLEAAPVPLFTAPHMRGVDAAIRAGWDHADRDGRRLAVRLLGHASAGQLHLGSTWMKEPDGTTPPEVYAHPYYVLTTNPSALNIISDQADKIASLELVGCNVGVSWASDWPINGRTLTYTLCELLQADVTGAMQLVGPEDFQDGRYRPTGARSAGWRYHTGGPPTPIETCVPKSSHQFRAQTRGVSSLTMTITQIMSAQYDTPNRKFPKDACIHLLLAPAVNDNRFRFATPQLSVMLDHKQQATVFGDGHFLMLGEQPYVIENVRQVAPRLASLLLRA